MSGKKYANALKGFDRDQFYTPTEALGIVKNVAKGGFDESVDVSIRLGVDPRKADQMVRGTVALPSGTGKDVRVAVFAAGEAAAEAREAGADIEEVAKIKMPDLNAYDLEAAKQQVRGTARSMGLTVA